MGQAIGGSLALAVGIALSPIPIIAVVLMLTSQKARVNGPAFVLGWLIGLGVVGAIVLALAGPGGASRSPVPRPRGWGGSRSHSVSCFCWWRPGSSAPGPATASKSAHAHVDGVDRQDQPAGRAGAWRRSIVRCQSARTGVLGVAGAASIAQTRDDGPWPRPVSLVRGRTSCRRSRLVGATGRGVDAPQPAHHVFT